MRSLFLSICLLLAGICHAKKYGLEKADSLKNVLQTETKAASRVKLMTDISLTLFAFNNKLGLDYAARALEIAIKTGDKTGEGLAYDATGVNYIFKGNFEQSIANLNKAEVILEKEGDKAKLAFCYIHIASAHQFVPHADTAMAYANKALRLFTQISDSSGFAECYRVMGLIYQYNREYAASIKWFDKGLEISQRLGQEDITGVLLADLGGTYAGQSNYIKSLTYSFDAIKLLEKIHGGFLSVPVGNVGYVYMMTKDNNRAKAYFQKAADIAEKQDDIFRAENILGLLGNICNDEKDYTAALKNFTDGLRLSKQINNINDVCVFYGNIGGTYSKLGDYATALNYLFKALQINKTLKDKWYGNSYLYAIGDVYLQLFKNNTGRLPRHPQIPIGKKALMQKAGEYLAKARVMASEAEDLESLVLILKAISEVKQLQGNPIAALAAYKESVLYKDSVFNMLKAKDITRKEVEYEYSRQQDSVKLETDKKEALHTAELKLQQKATQVEMQNKRIALISIFLLILLSSFIYYLFWQRKKLSKQLAVSLTTLKDTQQQLIKIEKEKEGEKIRQGISRDLHDDLGSDLYKISLLSEMMTPQMQEGKGKEGIEKIAASAKDSLEKMGEIVWTMTASQDGLPSLIAYFRKFAMEYFEPANIECAIQLPATVPDRSIPGHIRRALLLSYKEALRNVVRHAEAKAVNISFSITGGQLCICIHDNGKGIHIAGGSFGNGLSNMQKRMEETGGSFAWKNHNGTSIILTMAVDELAGGIGTSS